MDWRRFSTTAEKSFSSPRAADVVKATKIYVVDLGGRKLGSFFGTKKKAENLDKVPFYVELGGNE
jgi:hypothetical protein